MKLPSESKFQRWKWVELAHVYKDRLSREQHPCPYKCTDWEECTHRKPVLVEWGDEIDQYRKKYNNWGLYTSVFHYDGKDLDGDNQITRLGSLYFDLDNKKDPSIALEDTRRLVSYLGQNIPEEALRVYFTGLKGFHVEAEAIALGLGPNNDLPGLFRYIANQIKDDLEITSFDFSVYDLRRMWRLPNSIHQKTGLYKLELPPDILRSPLDTIAKHCEKPNFLEVPDQKFNAKANEWYREWVYKKETKVYTTEELIDRFKKFGTGIVRKVGQDDREFDPKGLFDNCHAIIDLWKQAEETHDLSHEARLFLCSILTYNEEAQFYLHEILKNCDDYNPQKSQAHIDDWIRRRELGIGGRPYTCERANSAGVGCGDCDLQPQKKYETIGDRMVETGEMASPSPIRYAYRRKN